MAIEVELPDGGVIEFPDGTPAETIKQAMAKHASRQQSDKFYGGDTSKANVFTQALGGAKHAWDRAAFGLKGLFTDLSPEEKAQLAQGREFVKNTGAASSVGEIAGDILTTAGPGAALYKGAKVAGRALPMAVQAARGMSTAGRGAAALASGAATGALVSPEDRKEGAIGGAVGTALGAAAGKAIQKVGGGVLRNTVTPEAQALIDQGIDVPIWKATANQGIRSTMEAARGLPVAGAVIKGQERRAIEQYNKQLIKEATPPIPVTDEAGNILRWEKPEIENIGNVGITQLKDRFNKAYDALYKGRVVPLDKAFDDELSSVVTGVRRYSPSIADDIEGAVNRVNDTIRPGQTSTVSTKVQTGPDGVPMLVDEVDAGHAGVAYDALRRARYDLDTKISSAWNTGDAEKATALEMVRSTINSLQNRSLPPEVASMKAAIDEPYKIFKRLERAAASRGAMKQEGVVTPRQQLDAVRALDKSPNKTASAQGQAIGQKDAVRAEQILGSELPEVGPGTAEKGMLGALLGAGTVAFGTKILPIAALATPTGQRVLTGSTKPQSIIRNKADIIADIMRQGGNVAGINVAIDQ